MAAFVGASPRPEKRAVYARKFARRQLFDVGGMQAASSRLTSLLHRLPTQQNRGDEDGRENYLIDHLPPK